jgi:hypothetical protein
MAPSFMRLVTTRPVQYTKINEQKKIQPNVVMLRVRAGLLFKAGKSMQKEIKGMTAEMNMKINEIIAAIKKLKIEYQTRTFVRNQPAVKHHVNTNEA